MAVIDTLQNNTTITASGSAVFHGEPSQDVTLFWRIAGPVTGTTPTIAFTVTEVDPSDETTQSGSTTTSPTITATGNGSLSLRAISSPTVKVSWAVTGTTPSFGGVFLTISSKITGTYSPLGEGSKNTYTACGSQIAGAAAMTDVCTITGSATKTIKVTRFSVSGIATAANQAVVLVIKRSAANTAGTSTTQTNVPHISTNPAATATVRTYTANPTLGTTVGNVRARRIALLAVASASVGGPTDMLSGVLPGCQVLTLIGTAEVLAVNFNGATIAGNSLSFEIEWTEEG